MEQQKVNEGLVALQEVATLTTLSTKHIQRLERTKQFPPRVKLGRRTAWVRTEVMAWIVARAQERFAATPPNAYERDSRGRFNTSVSGRKVKAGGAQ